MIHLVDPNPHDLLHAPLVRERLGPERIDAVLGRAVRVDGLSRDHLRVADAAVAHVAMADRTTRSADIWSWSHDPPPLLVVDSGPCLR